MTLGPAWLVRSSDFMPTRWVVDAVRGAFGAAFTTSSMAWGIGWTLVLFLVVMWWGTRTFRKENS